MNDRAQITSHLKGLMSNKRTPVDRQESPFSGLILLSTVIYDRCGVCCFDKDDFSLLPMRRHAAR